MKKFKLAILGDSATQLISRALITRSSFADVDIEIYESNYDQIDQEICNSQSDFYRSEPDGVLLYFSVEKLQERFYSQNIQKRAIYSEEQLSRIRDLTNLIRRSLPNCKIFITNFAEISDGVFGNNANKYPTSLLSNIRKLNFALMDLAQNDSNTYLVDMAALNSVHGRNFLFDSRLYDQASLTFSGKGVDIFAEQIIALILASLGGAKKCLILDLDNTIWGGVIGDDGVEKIEIGSLGIGKSFSRLQRWAKELQQRGILLAICSKNTEEVARAPFESHPEMVLRLDDIAIFVANWDDKATNIKFIQSNLNIGFDSMVFVDDNAFERALVKQAIPQICVPDLPEDPADYVDFLVNLNLFEPGILSSLDLERTKMIKKEIERNSLKKQFSDESEFLKSIHMNGKFESFSSFNTPRVAQLSERSNQYNMRTVRYSESDVCDISNNKNKIGMAISLRDDLGDHGLISVIVLANTEEELFIENWFMSCRVLKRGVELMALNKIVEHAKKLNCKSIVGEFIPTPKNGLVKDHYQDLGFTSMGNGKWHLIVKDYAPRNHFIQEQA